MDDFKDFKIRRGLSTTLFKAPGILNDRVIIEEGYWYLCVDTAELFLGVKNVKTSELDLVRINANEVPTKLSELINDCKFITETALNEAFATLDIPEVPTKLSELENDLGYLTEHQDLSDYAKIADIPSIEGLATKQFVSESVAGIVIPDTADFITMSEVESKGYLTMIPSDYITESELSEKGYLTEHQDLSAYAKLTDIPSHENLASKKFVTDSIEAIKFPETDLKDYSTTLEMSTAIADAVKEKVDKILFNTTKIVNNPIGNFTVGEDLKDLTITEILAKLLGLTDTPSVPGVLPDGPQNIVANIIANQTPMYTIASSGSLEVVPYKLLTFTEESAGIAPNESGFYQIKDKSGKVIESGYQLLSEVFLDMPFSIALPKAIEFNTHIEVQSWNDLEQYWESKTLVLSSDIQEFTNIMGQSPYDIFPNIDSENYTIWFNADDGSTGAIYRFIIHE